MMLPKGIVINAANVYDEVANFPLVPADRVWQLWHVYTTTNKRLRDPTACRLENFWWHVWGSDRRLLSGRTLARLYEHISDGPTIAPLQGPPNRWEGPDAPQVTRQLVLAHLSNERDAHQPNRPPPPPARPSNTSIKSLPSPSASRPPAPHPILKKTRGPSSSGPRPTARVISPHDSPDDDDDDDDDDKDKDKDDVGKKDDDVDEDGDDDDDDDDDDEQDADLASSTSTVITVIDRSIPQPQPQQQQQQQQPAPPPPAKKKPAQAGKKFLVPSTTARRRPVLPRRTSSQSTGEPAATEVPRDAAPSQSTGPSRATAPSLLTTSSRAAGQQHLRPVSPIPERTRSHEVAAVDETPAPPPPPPSAKALGKRPALAPRHSSDRKGNGRSLSSTSLDRRARQQQPKKTTLPRAQSFVDETTLPKVSRTASDTPPSTAKRPVVMSRAQSSHGDSYGRGSDARSISQGLFTGATASMTNVAAQGTIIDQAGSLPTSSIMDTPPLVSPAGSSLLGSRLTPTQPAPSPRVPMARTRSQLTLLLEREKERAASEKSRFKG
ncbi:hypothetical protein CP532_0445 [Ophiocordyceps camponoti-leonardi (nom. inval.)]|nr:hypothetical protein CP532_0445 [Ophiocordyceps camponoti-leonardi (nom. inval.)]